MVQPHGTASQRSRFTQLQSLGRSFWHSCNQPTSVASYSYIRLAQPLGILRFIVQGIKVSSYPQLLQRYMQIEGHRCLTQTGVPVLGFILVYFYGASLTKRPKAPIWIRSTRSRPLSHINSWGGAAELAWLTSGRSYRPYSLVPKSPTRHFGSNLNLAPYLKGCTKWATNVLSTLQ